MQISQANLSHAIRDLEHVLDTRLFDRTTRRVELTEAGRAFAEGALAGLSEIDRASECVRELAQLRTGLVRLAAPPFLAATLLPALLRKVGEAYPGLVLTIDDVTTESILEQVRNGRCDLGVGTFPTGDPDLESQLAFQDQLMVFCSPVHAFAERDRVAWASLAAEAVIALAPESRIRVLSEIGFEAAGRHFRPKFVVHQIHTALSLVENGRGVAILPSYCLVESRGRGILARPLVDPEIVRDVRVITARDRALSKATLTVRPLIRSMLSTMVQPETQDRSRSPRCSRSGARATDQDDRRDARIDGEVFSSRSRPNGRQNLLDQR